MARTPEPRTDKRRQSVVTPDELVLHLREAGAKRVYLSRPEAFHDGRLRIVATYEIPATDDEAETGAGWEMLVSVFDAVGDHLWFHDRKWVLDWEVEPAFTEPQLELIPLYDRGVEHRHRDGVNLRNLLFVYDEYREFREET